MQKETTQQEKNPGNMMTRGMRKRAALAEERYVVAVKPGGKAWLERINRALRVMRDSGNMRALDRKFGLEPSENE